MRKLTGESQIKVLWVHEMTKMKQLSGGKVLTVALTKGKIMILCGKDVFGRARQVCCVSFISANDFIPKCLNQSECEVLIFTIMVSFPSSNCQKIRDARQSSFYI